VVMQIEPNGEGGGEGAGAVGGLVVASPFFYILSCGSSDPSIYIHI
jgi:hypothetical protein